MKLLNSLYRILKKEWGGEKADVRCQKADVGCQMSEGVLSYDIELDATHIIYKAHFPGEPVTPGVCIVQIAKELLEEHLGQKMDIVAVKNVKFLSVISPVETPRITYRFCKITGRQAELGNEIGTLPELKVQAEVLSADTLLAKLSFICK